jgi:hypothetical protein
MLKFIETKSSVLSENTFADKFAGKRILVLGSGPSVKLTNWQNIHVDSIVTTTFFYLNNDVRLLNNITHITLSEIIDFNDSRLHDFLQRNPECTIALEPKVGRPFYNTDIFLRFQEQYKDRLVFYNTEIDNLEGVAGRLAFFVIAFSPAELFYVGIDGKSNNPINDPPNAFRTNIIDGDNGLHSYEKTMESHHNMADTLYKYSLHNQCKLYNLGEGFEFNCSTLYSKRYFPLTEEIKQIIKK